MTPRKPKRRASDSLLYKLGMACVLMIATGGLGWLIGSVRSSELSTVRLFALQDEHEKRLNDHSKLIRETAEILQQVRLQFAAMQGANNGNR